eukprot:712756-Amorphochlora_amoeboformis.AAC.1
MTPAAFHKNLQVEKKLIESRFPLLTIPHIALTNPSEACILQVACSGITHSERSPEMDQVPVCVVWVPHVQS